MRRASLFASHDRSRALDALRRRPTWATALDSRSGRAVVDDLLGTDLMSTIAFRLGPIASVDAPDLPEVVVLAVLGALARAAVVGSPVARRRATFAVVAAMAATVVAAVASGGDDAVETALFGTAATAWLVWALRRARSTNGAEAASASAP